MAFSSTRWGSKAFFPAIDRFVFLLVQEYTICWNGKSRMNFRLGRSQTIDDADASLVKVYAVAQMRTRTVDLIQGHSRAGLAERIRGLMSRRGTMVWLDAELHVARA